MLDPDPHQINANLKPRWYIAVRQVYKLYSIFSSVADPKPDPDLSDPYVSGPPGSRYGSISQRYGSGSGSFYHQAKIVRKTLIPFVL
jgi:hypothetical protein